MISVNQEKHVRKIFALLISLVVTWSSVVSVGESSVNPDHFDWTAASLSELIESESTSEGEGWQIIKGRTAGCDGTFAQWRLLSLVWINYDIFLEHLLSAATIISFLDGAESLVPISFGATLFGAHSQNSPPQYS